MNYPKNEKELLDVEAVGTAVKRILGNLPETILTRHLVLRLVNATSMLRIFIPSLFMSFLIIDDTMQLQSNCTNCS